MRCSQGDVSKAEINWNEHFSDETLQWKNIYLTVLSQRMILNCAISSINI